MDIGAGSSNASARGVHADQELVRQVTPHYHYQQPQQAVIVHSPSTSISWGSAATGSGAALAVTSASGCCLDGGRGGPYTAAPAPGCLSSSASTASSAAATATTVALTLSETGQGGCQKTIYLSHRVGWQSWSATPPAPPRWAGLQEHRDPTATVNDCAQQNQVEY